MSMLVTFFLRAKAICVTSSIANLLQTNMLVYGNYVNKHTSGESSLHNKLNKDLIGVN